MDRYFESQVYPPPSKGIKSLGPKIYQRVSRLSPSTGHGGHRHEAFCTTPKSRPDSGPAPIHFLSILPPPHHFSLKIGFSCNPASKKHFYFLNCESHSKESCFKAELCTDTVRHQGNILTTGPVSWELTSLAMQSSHSEAGGPAASAHAKCLLTHRIPSTWALKAEHMAESQMGRKSPQSLFPLSLGVATTKLQAEMFIAVALKSLFKFLLLLQSNSNISREQVLAT